MCHTVDAVFRGKRGWQMEPSPGCQGDTDRAKLAPIRQAGRQASKQALRKAKRRRGKTARQEGRQICVGCPSDFHTRGKR